MLREMATAAVMASALLTGQAPERAEPLRFGMSDQHPETFAYPAHQQLGLDLHREMVDWDIATPERRSVHEATGAFDVHADRFQRWYDAIRTHAGPWAQREMLVSFTGNYEGQPPPSPQAARDAFALFRRKYPAVTHFTAHNEPNLRPFRRDPRMAGYLHRVLARACRAPEGPAPPCEVIAGDFADLSNLKEDYVRDYKRGAGIVRADARGEVTWAAHVYHSAYRDTATGAPRTPRGFEAFLARTNGDVWITEAGAFSYLREVRRPIERPLGDEAGRRHFAAVDLNWMLDEVVFAHPRVKRFYYYQWADHNGGNWDVNSPDDHFGTGLVRTAAAPGTTETYCVYLNRLDRAARQACTRSGNSQGGLSDR